MSWSASIHDEIASTFDELSWHADALEYALYAAMVAYRAAQAERYRDWRRFNKQRARDHQKAWRKRIPGRPAEIERKRYAKWKSKRTTEEMRAVWRARKAKHKTAIVRVHHCRACGDVGHNARACERRAA